LYPIARFSTFLSVKLLQLFKVKVVDKGEKQELGKVDLDYWVNDSFEHADNQEEVENEVKIFQNALDFSSVKLRDCIVPRTEIVSLSYTCSLEELRNTFIETGFSKIPIYKDNIDNIIGYFHSSDLFKQPADWHDYLRPIAIVPETMAANKLMNMFMQEKRSMALVVDEFGGTAGIVTLEDIMEEIFGEISDEHDDEDDGIPGVESEEGILVPATISLRDLYNEYDVKIPLNDNYSTLNGFLLEQLGNSFPKKGNMIIWEGFSFELMRVKNYEIKEVKIKSVSGDHHLRSSDADHEVAMKKRSKN
jgi:CBS domain containing-hemolysin-like protein